MLNLLSRALHAISFWKIWLGKCFWFFISDVLLNYCYFTDRVTWNDIKKTAHDIFSSIHQFISLYPLYNMVKITEIIKIGGSLLIVMLDYWLLSPHIGWILTRTDRCNPANTELTTENMGPAPACSPRSAHLCPALLLLLMPYLSAKNLLTTLKKYWPLIKMKIIFTTIHCILSLLKQVSQTFRMILYFGPIRHSAKSTDIDILSFIQFASSCWLPLF